MPGLEEGSYFVEVLNNKKQIRLYKSRSFIPIGDFEEFEPLSANTGSHTFSLVKTVNQQVGAQKYLKEFPLNPSITNSNLEKTLPGSTGILINGVEIFNYKSEDRIFFGPLENIQVLNGGNNYDVINPPVLEINSAGAGTTTALVRPVISGNVIDIQVDPQDFDIQKVLSVTIEGGNGSGATFEPILSKRKREIPFDGRLKNIRGGVDHINDVIDFYYAHNLQSGEPLIYNNNVHASIAVSYTHLTLPTKRIV